jgi:hypothetical protein
MSQVQLVAGATTVDITPDKPEGMYLAGFACGRRALGVAEPLEAGILYLSDGRQEVVLCSVDAIGLMHPLVQSIRDRVESIDDKKNIIICATHTHSAPDTMGIWGPGLFGMICLRSGVDDSWRDALVVNLASSIDRAKAQARPANLHAASFEVDPAWTRNDRKGGGRYDHAGAMALVAQDDGTRLATLLNFASHPEALWADNQYISPDFPGPFRRHAKKLTTGPKLYFSGPLGGMLTPNVPEESSQEERKTYIESLGQHLAQESEKALSDAPAMEDAALVHHHKDLALKNSNWRFSLMAKMGLLDTSSGTKEFHSEVHYVRLGDVEICTAPGELLPEVGHEVRQRMTANHRWLLCLANDEVGYVLKPEMFDNREYRYEASMSLGRHTAGLLMDSYEELLG